MAKLFKIVIANPFQSSERSFDYFLSELAQQKLGLFVLNTKPVRKVDYTSRAKKWKTKSEEQSVTATLD